MTRRTRRVRSTGAESTPTNPVQAPLGVPESTDAKPFDAEPVTTRVSYLDESITVNSPDR